MKLKLNFDKFFDAARLHWSHPEDLVGLEFVMFYEVSAELIDSCAAFSGDVSPRHVSDEAAQRLGHPTRISHGLIHLAALSQVVGVHCPGERSLLQSVDAKFLKPCYVGDRLSLAFEVEEYHESVSVMICRARISNQKEELLCRAKLQVGISG